MLSKFKEYFLRFYYFIFDRFILYPLMQRISKKFDIKFMNLGYLPSPNDKNVAKIQSMIDKVCDGNKNMAHIFLYEKALSMSPIYPSFSNFIIAEVGCGLGGGIEWIKRAHPESLRVIGIDKVMSTSATMEDGTFLRGNAESLPLPNSSVNLILNIESSHLYGNPKKFFAEVYRVLKPNGYFCWADLRFKDQMPKTLEEIAQAKLHLISYEDITAEVLNGIEFTSKRYDQMLDKAPWFVQLFRNSIRATYCAPGTHTFARFARREKIYAAGCWCKNEEEVVQH